MTPSSDRPPTAPPIRVRVLFVGNQLAGDDGVALHLLKRLRHAPLPEDVELIEGATAGLSLIDHFFDVPTVVIVDAIATGGPPGSVLRLEASQLPEHGRPISCHDLGVEGTVAIARRLHPERLAERVVVLGVTAHPASSFDTELSEPVAAAVPELERELLALVNPPSTREPPGSS